MTYNIADGVGYATRHIYGDTVEHTLPWYRGRECRIRVSWRILCFGAGEFNIVLLGGGVENASAVSLFKKNFFALSF